MLCAMQPVSKVSSFSEYLTASEVAAILKISEDSVIARFDGRPGVLDLGSPEARHKRRYRVLRIPREAVLHYIHEKRVQ